MARLRDLVLGPSRRVPAQLLAVRFSRSGGPGGQHVNRTESKVDLRLDLDGLREVLGPDLVARIRSRLSNRLDADGNLFVVSDEHREQGRNLEAALARMEALLRGALAVPRKRRKTRPTRGSVERRLRHKRQRSQIKKWRTGSGD